MHVPQDDPVCGQSDRTDESKTTTTKQKRLSHDRSADASEGSRCDGMEDKSNEKQAIGTRKHQETQHIQDCRHGEGEVAEVHSECQNGEERSCE